MLLVNASAQPEVRKLQRIVIGLIALHGLELPVLLYILWSLVR